MTIEGTHKPIKVTSSRKIEANRRNAQRSTGPKTAEGKAKSSQNSITHGILVKKFLNGATPETIAEIETLAAGIREHCQPVGMLEDLLVQKIVIELARDHRVLGVEQEFDGGPMLLVARLGLMARYTTSTSRALFRAIAELEREQTARKARESSAVSATGEPRLPITTEEQSDSAGYGPKISVERGYLTLRCMANLGPEALDFCRNDAGTSLSNALGSATRGDQDSKYQVLWSDNDHVRSSRLECSAQDADAGFATSSCVTG